MKKIVFSLAFSVALLSSATMYAGDATPGATVKKAFNREFAQVKDVEWIPVGNEGIYQAKFIFNNESVQAFFSETGEFLGTTRQILKSQLPILVAAALQKEYAGDRIATIFEYSKTDGLAYYITLDNKKGGVIVKATGNGELTIHKRNLQ